MKKMFFILASFFFIAVPLQSQTTGDYKNLYQNKEYEKSYEIIKLKFSDIYGKRMSERRIPAGYISLTNVGEDVDLLTLFRNRKEKGFFIEENNELTELHLYAARCCVKLGRKKDGLNHYVNALRFRKIELQRDDVIYYEIAQVFKTYNEPVFFKGYISALEQAYTLNTANYRYSYEIGEALYITREPKKAIFHYRRYIDNTEEVIKPEIYLKLGNLYENIEKYLETEKYYNEYLRLKPEDAEILFALGHICYTKTGNYILAESSFNRAIKILKEGDIYRRSKSYEYLGDMSYHNLKYEKAINLYLECINYQGKVLESIEKKNKQKSELNIKINELKTSLIRDREFERYEDYEILVDERNKIDREIEKIRLEFNKLDPGRVRWFIAVSNENLGKYDEAIKYYREAVRFEYNANNARDMIVKLQLKINRGY